MDDDELKEIREKKRRELEDRIRTPRPMGVIPLDEAGFASALSTYPRLVVDFWAEWCGPCRMMAPIFDRLAHQYGGAIVFAKCNTDDNQGIAMRYQISAIPTILMFSQGQLVDRVIGAYPEEVIRQRVARAFPLDR